MVVSTRVPPAAYGVALVPGTSGRSQTAGITPVTSTAVHRLRAGAGPRRQPDFRWHLPTARPVSATTAARSCTPTRRFVVTWDPLALLLGDELGTTSSSSCKNVARTPAGSSRTHAVRGPINPSTPTLDGPGRDMRRSTAAAVSTTAAPGRSPAGATGLGHNVPAATAPPAVNRIRPVRDCTWRDAPGRCITDDQLRTERHDDDPRHGARSTARSPAIRRWSCC